MNPIGFNDDRVISIVDIFVMYFCLLLDGLHNSVHLRMVMAMAMGGFIIVTMDVIVVMDVIVIVNFNIIATNPMMTTRSCISIINHFMLLNLCFDQSHNF